MATYLDNAATTPLDPRVARAMQPYLDATFGNPSSLHRAGREARAAVDEARTQVAALIGAEPAEIVFTASGTEADNLALVGAFEADADAPPLRHERHRAPGRARRRCATWSRAARRSRR